MRSDRPVVGVEAIVDMGRGREEVVHLEVMAIADHDAALVLPIRAKVREQLVADDDRLVGIGQIAVRMLEVSRDLDCGGPAQDLRRPHEQVDRPLLAGARPRQGEVRVVGLDPVVGERAGSRDDRVLLEEGALGSDAAVDGEVVLFLREAGGEGVLSLLQVVVEIGGEVVTRIVDGRAAHDLEALVSARLDEPGRCAAHLLLEEVDADVHARRDGEIERELMGQDFVALAGTVAREAAGGEVVFDVVAEGVGGARLLDGRIGASRERETRHGEGARRECGQRAARQRVSVRERRLRASGLPPHLSAPHRSLPPRFRSRSQLQPQPPPPPLPPGMDASLLK